MKLIKSAVAVALSALALSASAMTPIQDTELSAVTGQDGVSIFADLNVKMDSFVYTDTDANGGSVSFNNISVKGLMAATIDILAPTAFLAKAVAAGVTNAGTFYTGGDVVAIAIPADVQVAAGKLLDIKVGGITMGHQVDAQGQAITGPSYGSMAMNQVDLRGTTVYIWAH